MSAKEPIFRAGIIPFVIEADGTARYMFMKPSDPDFGGPDWQMAKGRVENDDDNYTTAIREGREELGLKESNIIEVIELGVFLGRTCVFICHVRDKNDFDPFDDETGDVIWLTLEEFQQIGRKIHRHILVSAETYVNITTLVGTC